MAKYWKEYYMIARWKNKGLQLRNNWHEWNQEEWHLISVYRKWNSYGGYEYYFAFLGFKLRLITYKNRGVKN